MTETQLIKELRELKQEFRELKKAVQPEWVSEATAMQFMGRKRDWFRNQRLGKGEMPATLIKDKDWKYVNGRTPMYKMASLEKRRFLVKSKAAL